MPLPGRARSSDGRQIWILLAVSFAARLAFILYYGIEAPLGTSGDDDDYDRIARQLALSGTYENLWFPPGYPLFLSAIYVLFGPSLAAVRTLQALLGAATIALTYALGRRVFSRQVGFLGGLLLAVYPAHIFISWRIIAEPLYTFLITLSLLLAVKTLHEPEMRSAASLSLSLGAANAVKSNLILFAPLLFVLLAVVLLRRRPRGWTILPGLLAVFSLTALITPAANLTASGGDLAFLPGNAGVTLWWSNHPLADGYFVIPDGVEEVERFIERQGLRDDLERSEGFRKDRIYGRLALLWIEENPAAFFALCRKKLSNAYGLFPTSAVFQENPLAKWTHAVSYGGLVPFMAIGLVLSLRRWRAAAVLYLVLLSYTVMVLIFYGAPRFTVIVTPSLLLFAALGLIESFRWLRSPRYGRAWTFLRRGKKFSRQ